MDVPRPVRKESAHVYSSEHESGGLRTQSPDDLSSHGQGDRRHDSNEVSLESPDRELDEVDGKPKMKIEFCPYCNRRHFRPRVTERVHIEFEYYLEFFWCDCRQFFFRWHFQAYKLYSEITTLECFIKDESQFKFAIRMVLKLEHAYLNAMWKHAQKNQPRFSDCSVKVVLDEIKVKIGEHILK